MIAGLGLLLLILPSVVSVLAKETLTAGILLSVQGAGVLLLLLAGTVWICRARLMNDRWGYRLISTLFLVDGLISMGLYHAGPSQSLFLIPAALFMALAVFHAEHAERHPKKPPPWRATDAEAFPEL